MSRGRRISGMAMLVVVMGIVVGGIGPGAGASSEACILPVLTNAPGTLTYCVTVTSLFRFAGCDAVTCRVIGRAEAQASGPAGGSGRVFLFWDGNEASGGCSWTPVGPASCYSTAEGTLEWAKADGCRTWGIAAVGHVIPVIPLQLPIEGVMRTVERFAIRTCSNGQIT